MMPPRGSFERRLLAALVLFSVVPSLLLIWAGSYVMSEVVALHATSATFERIATSGRDLLALAEASGDSALARAAADHRQTLSSSLLQSGRWDYLNERVLRAIPLIGLLLAMLLMWLAVRAARGISREMARPIHELVGWAGRISRGQSLPPESGGESARPSEFAALRQAFRAMAGELAASRERAVEAERTRTWVTMARSVAHELKNSLTPLRLAVRALQVQALAAPETREPIEVITSEAARLDELARAFSQFGRLPEGPASEVDLGELIQHLIRTHLPPQLQTELTVEPGVPHVHAHHDVLSRAFANLLLNSAEALGEGGGSVRVHVAGEGEVARVRIRDSGPGFAAGDLDRIWDPDFTTKARGTGLGLALVRQAVHAHGGAVEIENAVGGGAEVRVTLPVRQSPVPDPSDPALSEWPAS
jgi:two-component system nitrogen regulation sensor histidine kinase NtrY